MDQYLMGIDNGGTSIKCALFDPAGREVAVHSFAAPVFQPAPGFVERDLADVWRWNCAAIRKIIAEVDPASIAAVSMCGFGGGACLLQADGSPAYPCVVSTDTRAEAQVRALQAEGVEEEAYAMTQQRYWSGQPAPLLRNFREERPDVLARTAHLLMIKDYIRYRLTGRLAMELTDASNAGLIELSTGKLVFPGLDGLEGLFPRPLMGPGALCGRVTLAAAADTGLCPGTPVAAGLYDVAACAAAAGLSGPDTLCLITGTWSIGCYLARDYRAGRGAGVTTATYLPGAYLVEESSATSASNLDWLVQRFLAPMNPVVSPTELYSHCSHILQTSGPSDSDVVFVPYLYASATTPGAHGAFFNLQSHHGPDELTRAVMEGVLFSALRHMEVLQKNREPFARIRLSGGITASAPWVQMLADMLGLPIEIMEGSQQGARGAAMCAAICAGLYNGFGECMQKMLRKQATFYPNIALKPLYERKFSLYNRAIYALQTFYE